MNEFDFIRRLRAQTRSRSASSRLITGIGDDAAVIDQLSNSSTVVTTDLLLEDIDFRRDATPPRLLGHKALAVSLSDIAAMGARPRWSLISIGLPAETWNSNFKDELFEGYFALAARFGVTLAGGDVSRTPERIVIDSVVIGEVPSGAAVLRSGAHRGDQIYVTGTLGGAAAGLRLIELGARLTSQGSGVGGQGSEDTDRRGTSPTVREGSVSRQAAGGSRQDAGTEPLAVASGSRTGNEFQPRSDDDAIQALLLRQLRPQPRVGWGIILGEERLASAMIDISDGLSSDLNHLCEESKVGAIINASSLPMNQDVKKLCGRRALDPLALALHGGEDFELLFTVRPPDAARLPKQVDGVAISRIGEITKEAGSILVSEKDRVWELEPGGFDHFPRTMTLS